MILDSTSSGVVYKEIPGMPGYAAGTDGTIWTCRRWGRWKPLRLTLKKRDERLCVGIRSDDGTNKQYMVHHLILLTFVGPRPPEMQACHYPNLDRTDNRLCNLMWGTAKQNAEHRKIHGTQMFGESHHQAKLTEPEVVEILRKFAAGAKLATIAREYGINRGTAWMIRERQIWRHVDA